MVEVCEEYRGTRRSRYYYVVEGHLLRHISRYAVRKNVEDESVYWDIPIEKVSGKPIIAFDYSGSGYGVIAECRIEDFIGSKYRGSPNYGKLKWTGPLKNEIWRLRGCKFEIFKNELKELVDEFTSLYAQMINDIRKYSKQLGFGIFFVGHAPRVENAYHYGVDVCLFECLSNPEERSRLMSLRTVCRWIYQLWVLKLVCEAVGTESIKRRYEGEEKPEWIIEQGNPRPTCILETPRGPITCWFEFQPHKMAHLIRVLVKEPDLATKWFRLSKEEVKRLSKYEDIDVGNVRHVRPDLVVVKGEYKHADEVIESIDLIIECKERKFQDWESDIDEQISAYLKLYKPKKFVLASLKPVPNFTKSKLAHMGIGTIDNLNPDNKNAIEKLAELVHQTL